LQPTRNKLNGTSIMVYSVIYYLKSRKVVTPSYIFYVLPKRELNRLYGLYFMKTYILIKKLEHCVVRHIVSDSKYHKLELKKTIN